MTEKSFARFYLEKIALSEGCGCAEQFIGTQGIYGRAQRAADQTAIRGEGGTNPVTLWHLVRSRWLNRATTASKS